MADFAEAPAGGFLASARRTAKALAATAANRFELFLVEAQEERDHLFRLVAMAVVALVLFIMALTALTAALVLLAGPEHRILTLFVVCLIYAGSGLWVSVRMSVTMRRWESFSATLKELKRDRECLNPPR